MAGYLSKKGVYISATDVGTESSPTYTGLTLSGLTASTVIYADASKAIASLANGSGYLLNDGSGGLSWAAVSLSGYLKADGTVPLTADWNVGAFDLTMKGLTLNNGTAVDLVAIPDGSMIYGAGASTPIGSLTDVTLGTVSGGSTVLNKTAHGLTLYQGDIVAITSCTTSTNRGVYVYCGSSYDTNTIDIIGTLTGSDTDIALTVYRNCLAIRPDGEILSMTSMVGTNTLDARVISYLINQTGSNNSRGLQVFFGSTLGQWGAGEEYHYPFSIYRNLHRENEIFKVNAHGDVFAAGNISATGGAALVGNVTATPITTNTAPTITPSVAGSTTWTYVYVPKFADGSHGAASYAGSTVAGPATLSSTVSNRIAIPYIANAYAFDVYRTVAGGTPSSIGKISSDYKATMKSTTVTYVYDLGEAGDASTAPTTNTTGYITGSRLGLGTTDPGANIHVLDSQNAPVSAWVINANSGGAAKAQFIVGHATTGNHYALFGHLGENFTTSGIAIANRTLALGYDTGGMAVGTGKAYPLLLVTNNLERMSFDSAGVGVINDAGNDSDFRIEGDTDVNLVFIDAGNDRVGVGTATPEDKFQVAGNILSTVINNADSDTDEVDSLTWVGGYGMVVVACSTDSATAIYRLEGTTLTAISANALFDTTKDHAATYNIYFETGALKVQNKVGNDKAIKVGFFGL